MTKNYNIVVPDLAVKLQSGAKFQALDLNLEETPGTASFWILRSSPENKN